MKTTRIILLLVTLVLITKCGKQESEKFSIEGKVKGGFEGYIFLKFNEQIDSALVSNNTFYFKGSVEQPVKGLLYPGNPTSKEPMTIGLFMLENSDITLETKYSLRDWNGEDLKMLDITMVNGSESQKLMESYDLNIEQALSKEANDSIREAILYEHLFEFINNNPKSILSGEYLASQSNFYGYLTSDQMKELSSLLDTSYQNKNDLKRISSIIKRRTLLDVGNTPPKIVLPNQTGNLIGLESLSAEMVLIEFWASWCAPCRQTNPELKQVYKSFDIKNFEIYAVSIDNNLDSWKNAIEEDQLEWIHVIDTLKTTTELYNLTTIPYNILLDKNRKIIARNLKPNKLKKVLAEKIAKHETSIKG